MTAQKNAALFVLCLLYPCTASAQAAAPETAHGFLYQASDECPLREAVAVRIGAAAQDETLRIEIVRSGATFIGVVEHDSARGVPEIGTSCAIVIHRVVAQLHATQPASTTETSHAPAAVLQPNGTIAPRRHVRFRADPALQLSVRRHVGDRVESSGSTFGRGTVTARLQIDEPLCNAPCEVDLDAGGVELEVFRRNDRVAIPDDQRSLLLDADTNIELTFVDHSSARQVGLALLLAVLATPVVCFALGYVLPDNTGVLVGTGLLTVALGIAPSLIMLNIPDGGSLRATEATESND